MSLTDSRTQTALERPRDTALPARGSRDDAEAPNGAIAAATLAAGIACAVFGVLVVLVELNEGLKPTLRESWVGGPLAAKGLAATAVWAVAWGLLHLAWRDRELPWRRISRATTLLVGFALVTTFPPVFQLAGH